MADPYTRDIVFPRQTTAQFEPLDREFFKLTSEPPC